MYRRIIHEGIGEQYKAKGVNAATIPIAEISDEMFLNMSEEDKAIVLKRIDGLGR